MKFSFIAKVYRSGGSLVVTIPKDYIEIFNIKPGMRLYVTVEIVEKKASEEEGK